MPSSSVPPQLTVGVASAAKSTRTLTGSPPLYIHVVFIGPESPSEIYFNQEFNLWYLLQQRLGFRVNIRVMTGLRVGLGLG